MDAYLHRRTQASTAGLSSHLPSHATVIRNGRSEVIAASDLVPGDLIELKAGSYVPADSIVRAAASLQVDESALTGEAYPVRKRPFSSPADIAGTGRLRIAYAGVETLYGEIVRSVLRGTNARTPLQSAIVQLVTVLVVAASLLCVALAFIRWQQGHGVLDPLLSAVTLAVAALPEEFPIVFTFFLGAGN